MRCTHFTRTLIDVCTLAGYCTDGARTKRSSATGVRRGGQIQSVCVCIQRRTGGLYGNIEHPATCESRFFALTHIHTDTRIGTN